MGGRYPNKMIGDRNFKLIGVQVAAALEGINEYREEKDQSVVTGAPAGRQNQNGLPEIKWRHVMTMVYNWHTSNYLPRKFWYFALKMAAQVSNYIPILLENGQWTTPHEQKYCTKLYWRNLVPMFSLVYICRNRYSNKQRATADSQSIMGICVDNNPKSDGLLFYLPATKNWWPHQTNAWTRMYHMVPFLVIPIMEGLFSTYTIPPHMIPVHRHMKKKNIYTSKQKKCKNIRREKYSSTPGTTLKL